MNKRDKSWRDYYLWLFSILKSLKREHFPLFAFRMPHKSRHVFATSHFFSLILKSEGTLRIQLFEQKRTLHDDPHHASNTHQRACVGYDTMRLRRTFRSYESFRLQHWEKKLAMSLVNLLIFFKLTIDKRYVQLCIFVNSDISEIIHAYS